MTKKSATERLARLSALALATTFGDHDIAFVFDALDTHPSLALRLWLMLPRDQRGSYAGQLFERIGAVHPTKQMAYALALADHGTSAAAYAAQLASLSGNVEKREQYTFALAALCLDPTRGDVVQAIINPWKRDPDVFVRMGAYHCWKYLPRQLAPQFFDVVEGEIAIGNSLDALQLLASIAHMDPQRARVVIEPFVTRLENDSEPYAAAGIYGERVASVYAGCYSGLCAESRRAAQAFFGRAASAALNANRWYLFDLVGDWVTAPWAMSELNASTANAIFQKARREVPNAFRECTQLMAKLIACAFQRNSPQPCAIQEQVQAAIDPALVEQIRRQPHWPDPFDLIEAWRVDEWAPPAHESWSFSPSLEAAHKIARRKPSSKRHA